MKASSQKQEPPRSPWFYHAMALTTVLIWSFSFLHIINLNEAIDPVSVVVLRKGIFAIVLLGLFLWRRPKLSHLTKRDWGLVITLSLLSGPMYHFMFAWASGEDRTPGSGYPNRCTPESGSIPGLKTN